jgi:hypothetical protein
MLGSMVTSQQPPGGRCCNYEVSLRQWLFVVFRNGSLYAPIAVCRLGHVRRAHFLPRALES